MKQMLKMNWKHKLKNGNKDENLSKKKKKNIFMKLQGLLIIQLTQRKMNTESKIFPWFNGIDLLVFSALVKWSGSSGRTAVMLEFMMQIVALAR